MAARNAASETPVWPTQPYCGTARRAGLEVRLCYTARVPYLWFYRCCTTHICDDWSVAIAKTTIREATIEDVDALLPLVQAYRVFYRREPDARRERAFIESHLRNGTSEIYIAEVDGEGAGFMQLFPTYSTVQLAPSWILEDLFVDARHRKAGIASALLARALEHTRETGACGMFLETAQDNAVAQRVYERAGWTREGRFLKYNAPLE